MAKKIQVEFTEPQLRMVEAALRSVIKTNGPVADGRTFRRGQEPAARGALHKVQASMQKRFVRASWA